MKLVRCAAAEAVGLAVAACVKAEEGQANLLEYHAKLASVLRHFAGFTVAGMKYVVRWVRKNSARRNGKLW
jgi:hypothetical protein